MTGFLEQLTTELFRFASSHRKKQVTKLPVSFFFRSLFKNTTYGFEKFMYFFKYKQDLLIFLKLAAFGRVEILLKTDKNNRYVVQVEVGSDEA